MDGWMNGRQFYVTFTQVPNKRQAAYTTYYETWKGYGCINLVVSQTAWQHISQKQYTPT